MRIQPVVFIPARGLMWLAFCYAFPILATPLCLSDISIHNTWQLNLELLGAAIPGILLMLWTARRFGLFRRLRARPVPPLPSMPARRRR